MENIDKCDLLQVVSIKNPFNQNKKLILMRKDVFDFNLYTVLCDISNLLKKYR